MSNLLWPIDWPPIMCPRCWGMRFVRSAHVAQCYYCKHILTRRERFGVRNYDFPIQHW